MLRFLVGRGRALVALSTLALAALGCGAAAEATGDARLVIVAPADGAGPAMVVRIDGGSSWRTYAQGTPEKRLHLSPGEHVVQVWLLDQGGGALELPKISESTMHLRAETTEAELAIEVVRIGAKKFEVRFRADRAIQIEAGQAPRQFTLETPTLIALADKANAALHAGEILRMTCVREALTSLVEFELNRDHDSVSDAWSDRKSREALTTADACTNEAPPVDPNNICATDPSACQPTVDE